MSRRHRDDPDAGFGDDDRLGRIDMLRKARRENAVRTVGKATGIDVDAIEREKANEGERHRDDTGDAGIPGR